MVNILRRNFGLLFVGLKAGFAVGKPGSVSSFYAIGGDWKDILRERVDQLKVVVCQAVQPAPLDGPVGISQDIPIRESDTTISLRFKIDLWLVFALPG